MGVTLSQKYTEIKRSWLSYPEDKDVFYVAAHKIGFHYHRRSYKIFHKTKNAINTDPLDYSQFLVPGCRRAVDVAFVIDTSGSVTQANFNRIIQFLKLFVDRFDFPDSGTRSVSARKVVCKLARMGWNLLQNFECAEDLLERTTYFSETALVMLLRTPGLGKSFPTPNR